MAYYKKTKEQEVEYMTSENEYDIVYPVFTLEWAYYDYEDDVEGGYVLENIYWKSEDYSPVQNKAIEKYIIDNFKIIEEEYLDSVLRDTEWDPGYSADYD
jgi:hypothetical protein